MLRAGPKLSQRGFVIRPSQRSFFRISSPRRAVGSYAPPSPILPAQLHGWTLLRTKSVPELRLTAFHLCHDKTGTDYIHVAKDDKNNAFSIGFKTNAPDDTGVPHILEHTTLCGSDKYPVRDPFFKMLRRTFSTDMNAMTYPDHTVYPFSTTNQKDFFNLLSIYLDATLHPLLKATDFLQEGWRIGPENPQLQNDKLVFKGVVYNEMKGVMSDPDAIFNATFNHHIFPAAHNSGGNPLKIPDLSYAELKKFHKDHYHPSNAKIFTYGDIPLEHHLEAIGQQLDSFSKAPKELEIKLPIDPRTLDNHNIVEKGPVDPALGDRQLKISVSWTTGDTSDPVDVFSWQVIQSLLLEGHSSPLHKALVDSDFALDFSSNTGFDDSARNGIFTIGASGVKDSDAEEFLPLIERTLKSQVFKGFATKEKIDGLLHQVELSVKHITPRFGSGIMSLCNHHWFKGVDPLSRLAHDEIIAGFKERYALEGYLEDLVIRHLLSEKGLLFRMTPNPEFSSIVAREEEKQLETKMLNMGDNPSTRKQLMEQESKLQGLQEQAKDQDLSCLPTLKVSDIPTIAETEPVESVRISGVEVQSRKVSTNGMTFFRATQDLGVLPEDLVSLLPFFGQAIWKVGTMLKTCEEIEDLVRAKSGGINIGFAPATSPSDIYSRQKGEPGQRRAIVVISGYALDEKFGEMLDLIRLVINEADFQSSASRRRIQQALSPILNSMTGGVAEEGASYATKHAQARLTHSCAAVEAAEGLSSLQRLSFYTVPKLFEDHKVMDDLRTIQSNLLVTKVPEDKSNLRISVVCSPEAWEQNVQQDLEHFLSQCQYRQQQQQQKVEASPWNKLRRSSSSNLEHLPAQEIMERSARSLFTSPSFQVSHTAMSHRTVPYTHKDSAALALLGPLLTHHHLHHEIREKGGAYGSEAFYNSLFGTFTYTSYRDPSPMSSLSLMERAGAWAHNHDWSASDIDEAKLMVFKSIDAPRGVEWQGHDLFMYGIDDAMRQMRRERILKVNARDVQRVADEYLVKSAKEQDASSVCVIGPEMRDVENDPAWAISSVVPKIQGV